VRYWLGVAYLGLAGSVVTFPLYFSLIRWMGPGRAAYNGVAVPVVAMALSTVFEGYRWSGPAAMGAALAMGGLVIALSGRERVGYPPAPHSCRRRASVNLGTAPPRRRL
jgi:drug/metabolite transporter (DMT)-like permease